MGKEGFNNPIVAASGTLIRELMKSANYVAGALGWQISRNGDAEFNDVTVRGELLVSDPNGAQIHIWDNPGVGPRMDLLPENYVGHTFTPGSVTAGNNLNEPVLELISPTLDGGAFSFLDLIGAIAGNDSRFDVAADLSTLQINVRTDVKTPTLAITDPNTNHLLAQFTEAGGFVAGVPGTTTPETWHVMALQNLWVSRAGGYPAVSYKFGPDRTVSFTGQMKNGTIAAGTTINNPALPLAYRPLAPQALKVITAGGPGQAEVGTNGFIRLFDIPVGTTIIGFNGSYPIDPPPVP